MKIVNIKMKNMDLVFKKKYSFLVLIFFTNFFFTNCSKSSEQKKSYDNEKNLREDNLIHINIDSLYYEESEISSNKYKEYTPK